MARPAPIPIPARPRSLMPRRRLEIIIAGFGGQGVMVMGQLLAYAAMRQGLEVTWMPSYGPEQRGGTANCTVVISPGDIASPIVARPHVAVVMNTPSYEKFEPRVVPHGVLLVNSSLVPERSFRTDIDVFYVPAVEVAGKLRQREDGQHRDGGGLGRGHRRPTPGAADG